MREQSVRTQRHITLDEIGRRTLGQFKELNVILKICDGPVEALSDLLNCLLRKSKSILYSRLVY
jgi:translation initiation factor IF-2